MADIKALAEELIALSSQEMQKLAEELKSNYNISIERDDFHMNGLDMSFGHAIKALKWGHCIRRKGWNGKGLFVCKLSPCRLEGIAIDKIQSLPQSCKNILNDREGVAHIDLTNRMLIINPDGRADSWVPSSSDIFADDWQICD